MGVFMKILKTKILISVLMLMFVKNTNLFGWTALMKASYNGNLNDVNKLLNKSTDNILYRSKKNKIKKIYFNGKKYKQLFPAECDAFTIAAFCGNQEITSAIFPYLADDYTIPEFDDYGITPLMIAVMSGIKILIEREFGKSSTKIYNTLTQAFGRFPRGTALVNIALATKNQDIIELVQRFYAITTLLPQESYQPSDLTLGICLTRLRDQYE